MINIIAKNINIENTKTILKIYVHICYSFFLFFLFFLLYFNIDDTASRERKLWTKRKIR